MDESSAERIKTLESMIQPWEAREHLAVRIHEMGDCLTYLDEVSENFHQKDKQLEAILYMEKLVEQQKQILNYLKLPLEEDTDMVVGTMADYSDEDACPDEITVGDTVYNEGSREFRDRFVWGRRNLLLHFTRHANWRMFCRRVDIKDAIKAAIAGQRIEYNLYWDPATKVAVVVRGPVYDKRKNEITVQKITSVFPRTDERSLRAYRALDQLFINLAHKRQYATQLPTGAPEGMRRTHMRRWRAPYPIPKTMNLQLSDIPPGKGNSTSRPTEEELEWANNRLSEQPRAWAPSSYYWNGVYTPNGDLIVRDDPREAKREALELGRMVNRDMKLAEWQIDQQEEYQRQQEQYQNSWRR